MGSTVVGSTVAGSTVVGSTVVGSTVVGSTEAALDDAAQTIAATRANLVAVSRKQAVTEALSEALQTIESAKANLMYGAEGGTKALQQNLEQAITELEAEIAGIDDRLCPCISSRCKAQPVRQQPVWAPFSKKIKVAPARLSIRKASGRASSRDSSGRDESGRDALSERDWASSW
jgi:hypothetical protein